MLSECWRLELDGFDTYKFYNAIKLHFTTKNYDFFKYNGSVKVGVNNYNKLSDGQRYVFEKMGRLAEPKMYIVGNLLADKKRYFTNFTEESYLDYKRAINNGSYLLKEDLLKCEGSFNEVFIGNGSELIPEIMRLYFSDQISLFTACVTDKILDWSAEIHLNMFNESINRLSKAKPFYRVNEMEYKKIILDNFKK